MTRMLTKTVAALAIVGAMAIGTAAPSMAQVYLDGPGFSVGVGTPYYHRPYYYGYGPYHHRYWNHRYWDYD